MDVTSAYLVTVKNVPGVFAAIQSAAVPERFTHQFLRALGFKGTNDRAFINVLKGLAFLDANSIPTKAYKDYKDPGKAQKVLARQIRVAYGGLFQADENAQELTKKDAKGKLATLTGKTDAVVDRMAMTFNSLCKLADFSDELLIKASEVDEVLPVDSPALEAITRKPGSLAFSHVLYINLPATRDVAVYDAIFKSIRAHLL